MSALCVKHESDDCPNRSAYIDWILGGKKGPNPASRNGYQPPKRREIPPKAESRLERQLRERGVIR